MLLKSFLIGCCIFQPLTFAITEPETKLQPHIVFILADDYGYNDIGYHGANHGSEIKTPFLDSLAMSGVRLENYYVQPICTPTRVQLLTGRYQIHTGLQHSIIHHHQPSGIPLTNKLLPEQFKACGYDTHMLGKWHVGFYRSAYLPWRRGFDSYYGCLVGHEDYYTKYSCYKGLCGYSMNSQDGPTNETFGEYSAHVYAKKAKEIIENHDTSKPLFLYVALQSVHSPLQVPQRYMESYSHIQDDKRRTYAGMVAAMEETVKNITELLENAGIWNNTLLIFSTDNGGESNSGGNNWPLRGKKGGLYEGGIRGIGFVYGKMLDVSTPNLNINQQLMHVSDWYPTLLSAAGCPIVNGTQTLDGFDQWNSISNNADTLRTEILHNIDPLYRLKGPPNIRMGFDTLVRAAIRVGDWKLLTGVKGDSNWYKPQELGGEIKKLDDVESGKTVQLFNIASDPNEKNDVSDTHDDVVNYLLTRLSEYNRTTVPVYYPPFDFAADPKKHGGFWAPWMDENIFYMK